MERKGTLSGLSGMNARNLRAIRERYTYIVRGTGVNMTILCFSVGFRQIGTAIDNASANYHEQNKMPELFSTEVYKLGKVILPFVKDVLSGSGDRYMNHLYTNKKWGGRTS